MEMVIKIPATEIKVAYEEVNFKRVEEETLNLLKRMGSVVIKEVVKVVDEEEYRRSRKKGLESCGKKGNTKYIKTVFGVIQCLRRRFKEKGKKGGRYLADEKLGLDKRMITSPGLRKVEIESAVESRSYRKAAREENRWTGESRSHESIRQLVIKEGQKIKEQSDAQIKAAEIAAYKCEAGEEKEVINPEKIVYVETDATYLHRQSRKGKHSEKTNKKVSDIEVKIGIAYSGHENRYKGGDGKQKRLKEKFVYTGIGKGDEFLRKFSILCEIKHAMSYAKMILFGGDGAEWIKTGAASYFVGSIYMLCKYHLNKALKRALGYNKELEKKIKVLLRCGRIDESVKKIERIIKAAGSKSIDRIKKLKEFRSYILSNRDGINAIERLKKHLEPALRKLIRNTGAMEGSVDKIIAQRMKGRGMSWSDCGAESMLQVICKMNNNEWECWWASDRGRKIEVNEQDYKELETVTFLRDSTKHQPCIPIVTIPAIEGPHQDKIWVEILRDISDGSQMVR